MMDDDLPTGPGRRRDEGPAETPGLRRPRRTFGGRYAEPDDRPAGPGVRPQLSVADQRAQRKREARHGRPEPFYDLWVRLMVEALSGKDTMASPYPWKPQFNANVADLRARAGDDRVRKAMEEFADGIKAGRIHTNGKLWNRFVASFEKYGTGGGVATKIETDDSDETWL